MNYARIFLADTANGEGMRVSLFVSGCTHHCKGCFNSETWDFNYGKPYTHEVEQQILGYLENDCYDGLTILGGEPMEPSNQEGIIGLIRKTKAMGKTVWIYSGYTMEELSNPHERCFSPYTKEILALIDVLVDGEFHQEEKDISLAFRGSRNQRIWKKVSKKILNDLKEQSKREKETEWHW